MFNLTTTDGESLTFASADEVFEFVAARMIKRGEEPEDDEQEEEPQP